jgi:hypothetical protein
MSTPLSSDESGPHHPRAAAPPPDGYGVPPTQPYQPYPGPAAYPPGGYILYPQPKYNIMAILSLVFAVQVFPPLGIVFGAIAKRQIARTGERGIELAKIGFIVGIIFTALSVVFVTVWIVLVVSTFRDIPTPTPTY